jgi:sortase A
MSSRTGWGWRALQAATLVLLAIGFGCVGEAGWIHLKAYVAQVAIARAWSRAQDGTPDAKPWPWADTRPIAKLTASKGTHELMVLEGSNGRNLAFGPTHDPASVLPGERGNSVIEGHRDTHFAFLRDLRIGDTLRVDLADGRSSSFAIVDVRIVDSRRWRIALDADAARLTLVTCYPFDAVRSGGPLRMVITAAAIAGGAESSARRDQLAAR